MTRNRFPIQLLAAFMLTAVALPYVRPATCGMMFQQMETGHMVDHDIASSSDHSDCDDCTDSMDCCAANLTPAMTGDIQFPVFPARNWGASEYSQSVHSTLPPSLTPPPQA